MEKLQTIEKNSKFAKTKIRKKISILLKQELPSIIPSSRMTIQSESREEIAFKI